MTFLQQPVFIGDLPTIDKLKITSPEATELRRARLILQKHSTVLVIAGADVTKTLNAIDRLTAPFKPSRRKSCG